MRKLMRKRCTDVRRYVFGQTDMASKDPRSTSFHGANASVRTYLTAEVITLAPTATAPGIIAYQPSDGTTFLPEDLLEQQYTVTAGKLAAMGVPTTLLKAATSSASLYVMVDDQDRLWVGTDKAAPATGATYVVLTRTP